ncbi:MAG TPA: AraC family transcriptional regulator [Dongiaceae bacterium]|nr:AraC family transcriptional regulator [Dongiaceae bacterium]
MNNNNKAALPGFLSPDSSPPAFLVEWREGSAQSKSSERIYWELPEADARFRAPSKLRNAVATLYTDTTYVEVSDIDWAAPTTLTFTPNRIGFTTAISASSAVQYGYVQEKRLRAAGAGKIIFILPGQEIVAQMAPGRIYAVTCTFDTAYAESILGVLDRLSHTQLHNALDLRSPLMSSLLLRLMHEALYPGPISQSVAQSFGHAMLTECAHWLKTQDLQCGTDTVGLMTTRELQIIEEYLAGLSGKAPSVADLASACGFSERYFAKLFRELTGIPISQYIKAVQVSKAKNLLLETSLPLKEIAYRLGYSTSANFSASFRAATGSTPGQYRKSP